MLATLLLIQMLVTGFMTGLIWFVQVVHYPLFASVGRSEFAQYEDRHTKRTTLIVAPMMLAEAAVALALLIAAPPGTLQSLALLGAALLLVIWLSTALVQVPCHRQLCHGFARPIAHRLNVTNWIRTVSWSLRAAIAMTMLAHAMPALVGRT